MRLSHVGWNLGGLAFPLVVAAVTVPSLVRTLGPERFGLLALAWGLIGYAGALDLGIGRALTQMVSRLRGERSPERIPAALSTASTMTLVSGLMAGVLIAAFGLSGGGDFVHAPSVPPDEIGWAILLLAVALPAQAMSATFRGVNEAFMNFRGINLLRAALGVVNFAGPYAVSLVTVELPWLVCPLVASRLLSLAVYRRLADGCLAREGQTARGVAWSPESARGLISFGGWVTVSSVISPIMLQADRLFIASALSAAAVSAYVLPYELVVQSLVLVGAISSVMFPGLAGLMREQPDAWPGYFRRWLLRIMLIMGAVCSIMFWALPWFLPWWVGDALDPRSVGIGQILCLGVLANAFGAMHYSVLHASGRSDLTAKAHLVELPLFLVAMFFALREFGLIGAASVWVGRVTLDAVLLFLMVRGTAVRTTRATTA